MKKAFVLLLLLRVPLFAQSGMTAEDAVRIRLENNFDILIATNNAEIARRDAGKGTAEFLPTLDAAGKYGLATSDQETNSPFSFGKSDSRTMSGQVSLNWTLFDGLKMFAERGRYHELEDLGETGARNLIEINVVSILDAYFNLVRQEQLLMVDRSAVSTSEARLHKEEMRRELGGISSTDFLNAQVAYNNDRAVLLNRELEVGIARKELNVLLGRDPSTPIEVVTEITIPALDLDCEELLDLARSRNAGLMIARQNKSLADLGVRLARSSFFPRLSLNANYGYVDSRISSASPQFPADIESRSTDRNIGLALSMNLFNGNRDRIDLQTAMIEARNRELELKDTSNRLSGLVEQKLETLGKGLELVELEEQNVIAARQNLELQQDRYTIGAASSLEFRDAQVNLIRAESLLITARYQARITRLEIDQLTGKLKID